MLPWQPVLTKSPDLSSPWLDEVDSLRKQEVGEHIVLLDLTQLYLGVGLTVDSDS